MLRSFMIACLIGCAGLASTAEQFSDLYTDAVWSNLTGASTFQSARVGARSGQNEYYLSAKNEWYDTRGTRLSYQASAQGATVGVGYRRWLLGRELFAAVSAGTGVVGANAGRSDARVGLAGYTQWELGQRFTDLYGELFWVERADDAFLSLRLRPGMVLHRDRQGRLWLYAVGQCWASGTGESGTDNRVEAGSGLGYVYQGKVSLNIEARGGRAYRGQITERSYWNPMLIVAANF